MPDIAMCRNITCPLRESCYRFTAKPKQFRQSYAHFTPNPDGSCDHHITIRNTEEPSNDKPMDIYQRTQG